MRLKKKYDKDYRLKQTFQIQSAQEVIRQLVINYIINNDSNGLPCYVSEIVKYVKENKYLKDTSPSQINDLVQQELNGLSGLVSFRKDNQKISNKLQVVASPAFYSVFHNLTKTDYAHTRATHFIEHYLVEDKHKSIENTL